MEKYERREIDLGFDIPINAYYSGCNEGKLKCKNEEIEQEREKEIKENRKMRIQILGSFIIGSISALIVFLISI